MPEQTVLGFDFGTKRIGIAVGQTITGTAAPLRTVSHNQWAEITQLIAQWQPNALVVGLPLNADGGSQPMTTLAREFAAQLSLRYGLPVHCVDERYTTTTAREQLFNQGGFKKLRNTAIDSIAAAHIVESYLREHT